MLNRPVGECKPSITIFISSFSLSQHQAVSKDDKASSYLNPFFIASTLQDSFFAAVSTAYLVDYFLTIAMFGFHFTLVPWEINKFCSPRNSMTLLASPQEKLRLIKNKINCFWRCQCLVYSIGSYPFF